MNEIDLTDPATFKVWSKQNPDARKLLGVIVFRHRGSSARLPGDPISWAAYPLATWRGWTGFKRSTLDRRLKELVDVGLIEKERHRFAGSVICPWIRPTEVALKHVGTAADLARLKAKKSPPKKPASEATVEATPDATVEATVEATDHTTIPFPSTVPMELSKTANEFTGEGKGKAGKDDQLSVKKMVEAAFVKQYGADAFDPDDPEWQELMQPTVAKLEKLLAKFPRITGKHEPHVKHPYDMDPTWATNSPEVQAKRYAKYKEYVANWHAANGSEPVKPYVEISTADVLAKLKSLPDPYADEIAEWQKSKTTH